MPQMSRVIRCFAVMILIGAFLLTLPGVSKPTTIGQKPYQWRTHVVNCLFTATAASCSTGLNVYDIGQDFTFTGQVIILVLMQAGGLGMMIAGTLVGIHLARTIGNYTIQIRTAGVIVFICVFTISIEGIGAYLLYPMWKSIDVAGSSRLFWSIFHSVSAFCHSGLSLAGSNFVPYRGFWQVYGVILPLVVLGGMGFPVMLEICERPFFRSSRAKAGGEDSLYSRFVVTMTIALIVGGAALLWLCETPTKLTKQHTVRMDGLIDVRQSPDSLFAMQAGERFRVAFFEAAARSTGFRVARTDEQSLSPASHWLLGMLMFVGGSPGSAAGGIGTVILAILIVSTFAAIRNRSVPYPALLCACAVLTASLVIVFAATLLLCLFEGGTLSSLLFEAVSAVGNAGQSTGITSSLTRIGKLVLAFAMFAGRVVPLSLVAMITRPRE